MTESIQPVPAAVLAAFDEVRFQVEDDVAERCLAADDPTSTMGPEAEAMIRTGLGFISRMQRAIAGTKKP